MPKTLTRDLLASLVVFVVALPLCLGVAIASGVPPAMGLITGVIGGMVVGFLAGSPLQVSGPAAGLAVIVFELVQEHGVATLGIIILGAGLIQLIAGLAKWGQIFRAITPAVVYGMLAGIGVLIFASQFHVAVDDKPRASGLANLISIPAAIAKGVTPTDDKTHHLAALIGLLTIGVLLLWNKFRPKKLTLIPGALVAVLVATIVDYVLQLPTNNIKVPANLFAAMRLPTSDIFGKLFQWHILLESLALAFVASAETLLSAAAVDKMHSGARTDYDRELAAQGVGNMLCGLAGGVPMTGVIVRSSANVAAGAQTRLSAILHGAWLLVTVAVFPSLLEHIPTAALAAILVHTGYKLVNPAAVKRLAIYGQMPVIIYFVTLITIVVTDLLTGVIAGIALSVAKLLYAFTRLTLPLERNDVTKKIVVRPVGAITFVRLPALAKILDAVPDGYELQIDAARLTYIDHACLEMLYNWESQEAERGKSLVVEWDEIAELSWHQGSKLKRIADTASLH